jgi:16S rRNA (cytosine1402-N4)-methyltransferase
LDGTLGAGGYSEALLEASAPDGVVVGLDLDSTAVAAASQRLQRFGRRFVALHGGFDQAGSLLATVGLSSVHGAVLDLGLSSDQLEDPTRGFSFMRPGPLDMRFDTTGGDSLADLLRKVNRVELERILWEFGEEKRSREIAARICEARDAGLLNTVSDLVNVVVARNSRGKSRIHPATRTFQALRIAVNREMERLDAALRAIPGLLRPGGRFCVVSYHSLEDRKVKWAFREAASLDKTRRVVTKRPIRPSREEVLRNPRARSARLRALEAPFRFNEGALEGVA